MDLFDFDPRYSRVGCWSSIVYSLNYLSSAVLARRDHGESMRHKLFTAASVLSLLLGLSTVVLWVPSYSYNISCSWVGRSGNRFPCADAAVFSGRIYIAGGAVSESVAKAFGEPKTGLSFDATADKKLESLWETFPQNPWREFTRHAAYYTGTALNLSQAETPRQH